jgi:hypothetical protein
MSLYIEQDASHGFGLCRTQSLGFLEDVHTDTCNLAAKTFWGGGGLDPDPCFNSGPIAAEDFQFVLGCCVDVLICGCQPGGVTSPASSNPLPKTISCPVAGSNY